MDTQRKLKVKNTLISPPRRFISRCEGLIYLQFRLRIHWDILLDSSKNQEEKEGDITDTWTLFCINNLMSSF